MGEWCDAVLSWTKGELPRMSTRLFPWAKNGAKHSPLGSRRDFWGITRNSDFGDFSPSFEGIVIRKSKICHTGCLSSVLKLWVSDVTPYFHEPKVSYLEWGPDILREEMVRSTLPWDPNVIFGESPKTLILEISVKVLKQLSSERQKSVSLDVFLLCWSSGWVMWRRTFMNQRWVT